MFVFAEISDGRDHNTKRFQFEAITMQCTSLIFKVTSYKSASPKINFKIQFLQILIN